MSLGCKENGVGKYFKLIITLVIVAPESINKDTNKLLSFVFFLGRVVIHTKYSYRK